MVDLGIVQTIVLWSFLPPTITTFVLNLLQTFVIRQSLPQSDPRYVVRYRWVFTAVVASYLLYTLYQVDSSLPPNLYQVLDLNAMTFDVKDLKANYRTLSLQYHPDKVQGAPGNIAQLVQERYIKIRQAYEILKDPLLKDVYDKLGPGMSDCHRCKTEKDYLYHGLSTAAGFYVSTAFIMLLMTLTPGREVGRFWRLLTLAIMACVEAAILLTPLDPLRRVLWWRTSSERVVVLHQVFVVISIALSQIGPVWGGGGGGGVTAGGVKRLAAEVEAAAGVVFQEARVAEGEALAPVRKDRAALAVVRKALEGAVAEEWMMQAEPRLREFRAKRKPVGPPAGAAAAAASVVGGAGGGPSSSSIARGRRD
ncbi:hypothetical protein DFJ73DRAFT_871744 [Zopfochytrium polystomum]|nr:hypothetical protein DFJ73DRAFT_871744 [Zopfochytrium polystomum]